MKEGKSKLEFENCAQTVRVKNLDFDPAKGFTRYGEKIISGFETRQGRIIATSDENFVFGHFTLSRYYQYKDFQPSIFGYVTIGGVLYGNKFYYGISICSPEDRFSKKIGRENVKSRMLCFRPNKNLSCSLAGEMVLSDDDLNDTPISILQIALYEYTANNKKDLPGWFLKSIIQ